MSETVAVLSNEAALVARAAAEPVAFTAIYDHYFPRIYNYVRYRVQEAETADDITAQALEAAWTKLASYRPERAPFAVWLFAIARNAVNDHLRASSRRRWVPLHVLDNLPGSEPQPEQVVIHNEIHAKLLGAVSRLNNRGRDLIALKFAAGLTNRQIAELTGLGESNVGVILYRSMQQLRAELGKDL